MRCEKLHVFLITLAILFYSSYASNSDNVDKIGFTIELPQSSKSTMQLDKGGETNFDNANTLSRTPLILGSNEVIFSKGFYLEEADSESGLATKESDSEGVSGVKDKCARADAVGDFHRLTFKYPARDIALFFKNLGQVDVQALDKWGEVLLALNETDINAKMVDPSLYKKHPRYNQIDSGSIEKFVTLKISDEATMARIMELRIRPHGWYPIRLERLQLRSEDKPIVEQITMSIEEPRIEKSTAVHSTFELTFDDKGGRTNSSDSVSYGSQSVSIKGLTTIETNRFGGAGPEGFHHTLTRKGDLSSYEFNPPLERLSFDLAGVKLDSVLGTTYFEALVYGTKVYGPNSPKAGQKVLIHRFNNYDVATLVKAKPNKAEYAGHPHFSNRAYSFGEVLWGKSTKQHVVTNLNARDGQPTIGKIEFKLTALLSSAFSLDNMSGE